MRSEILAAAEIITRSSKVVFAWAMGVTQQTNGVDNILSIANTALLTGNAGKPGAGMMPIRGHSNVQGFGSMGVTVHLKEQIKAALEQLLGRPLNPHNDKYRGMPHRNCILLNAEDARSVEIEEHDLVTVQGDAGKLEQVEVIYGKIRRGAAMMFYPEVNVIFTAKVDTRSGTPAFKRVPVTVYQ